MKVTVCELHSSAEQLLPQWQRLVAHVMAEKTDLLLLPEMPFYPWLCSNQNFDAQQWSAAEHAHNTWLAALEKLSCTTLSTRPMTEQGQRFNRGFKVEQGVCTDVHTKYYLPEEEGFWETAWYQPGDGKFETFHTAQAACGMLICSDIWFLERARHYGRSGAHILLNPRANYGGEADRSLWQAATRVAAFSSGAWVLTSNLLPSDAEVGSVGQGWIVSPDGEVVAHTTAEQPFVTLDIDLDIAVQAHTRYPCYIAE